MQFRKSLIAGVLENYNCKHVGTNRFNINLGFTETFFLLYLGKCLSVRYHRCTPQQPVSSHKWTDNKLSCELFSSWLEEVWPTRYRNWKPLGRASPKRKTFPNTGMRLRVAKISLEYEHASGMQTFFRNTNTFLEYFPSFWQYCFRYISMYI